MRQNPWTPEVPGISSEHFAITAAERGQTGLNVLKWNRRNQSWIWTKITGTLVWNGNDSSGDGCLCFSLQSNDLQRLGKVVQWLIRKKETSYGCCDRWGKAIVQESKYKEDLFTGFFGYTCLYFSFKTQAKRAIMPLSKWRI